MRPHPTLPAAVEAAYALWLWLDVARYSPSIDHAVVREQLARDVPEAWLRGLCDAILRAGVCAMQRWHFPGDDLFAPLARDVGLPLGNLTSQLWANRYLDPVDHLVKDRLRHRAYLRYMDDMLLFGDDRVALVALARRVEDACHGLRLRLHPWDVHPTRDGVGVVGYRVLPDRVRVRRTSVARAERRLQAMVVAVERGELDAATLWASLRATFAHWDHADAWRLKERLLRRIGMAVTLDAG
ncbi:MAG: RNA-directed DNA polymerase [Polyangiales bacterium]